MNRAAEIEQEIQDIKAELRALKKRAGSCGKNADKIDFKTYTERTEELLNRKRSLSEELEQL